MSYNYQIKIPTNKKEVICINCGKKGHIYKKCRFPIMSYGIICIQFPININKCMEYCSGKRDDKFYKIQEKLKLITPKFIDKYLRYLFIQRRNSLSMIEFIRGKYKINDIEYLNDTFYLMPNNEKEELMTNSFDDLWKSIWNNNNNHSFMSEYEDSKKKYETLKKGTEIDVYNLKIKISLDNLIKNNKSNYHDQEWGLPKGRRNLNETDIEAAFREFEEETNIKKINVDQMNIHPFNELFMGSNKTRYKHKYYMGQIKKKIKLEISTDNNEVRNIQWFTANQSFNKIRDYNFEKRMMIKNVHYILKNMILAIKEKLLSE
jgi:8-oxo-dGTP pyrophosphatase MutT (NUDIX family)